MKKMNLLMLLPPLLLLLGWRAKPTKVVNFPGPSPEVFYTAEVWEDNGAMSSDSTRVFAHLNHDGRTDKQVFLDGPYLAVSGVKWNGSHATVCLSEGRVKSFHREISLHAAGETYEIRNQIDQNCPK
jgi:hypothetical protein